MEQRYSVGQIQRELNRRLGYSMPMWRVQYLLKARGIQPLGRFGVSRIFNEDAVNLIEKEVRQIDANRPTATA